MAAIKRLGILGFACAFFFAVHSSRAEDLTKGGYVLKPFSKEFQRLAKMNGT